ncbi:unnamed protein product, partial [Durusdinium trenchii]
MAALQPCAAKYHHDLEDIHRELAGAQDPQELAERLVNISVSRSDWEGLLRTGKGEDAGSIAQCAIETSLTASAVPPDLEELLADFFQAVVSVGEEHPHMAALVLGGALSGLRHKSTCPCALPIRMLQIWFEGKLLEIVVSALIGNHDTFRVDGVLSHACAGWLCSLPDRVSQAFGTTLCADFASWLDSVYVERLVAAVVSSTLVTETDDWTTALELWARLALRGNAARLAAEVCAASLRGGREAAALMGRVILKLSEEHVASRSLVAAILEAATLVLRISSSQLVAFGGAVELLLELLGPSVGTSSSTRELLAVHLWRTSNAVVASSAPVVFAVVDLLLAGEGSEEVARQWLKGWASGPRSDAHFERALGWRIARALVRAPMQDWGLLLQGVQHRLAAQDTSVRLVGMAVAEIMAEIWRSKETEDELRFDHFDRNDASVAAFQLVKQDFQTAALPPPDLPADELPSPAAQQLRALLALGGGRVGDVGGSAVPLGQDDKEVEVQPKERQERAPERRTVEADSDDEEEDHPLRGLAPLTPLAPSAPEECADLLLVQPPLFLRAAYEMLLGPAKAPQTPLSAEAYGKPGAAPEPLATARARVSTALAGLPKLIADADASELPRLAAPLCARLLRLEAVGSDLDNLADLKLKVLVSLLVADGSRRPAVQNLINEFGKEDLSLATRNSILEALATASRELAGAQAEKGSAPHESGRDARDAVGQSRRFAAARRTRANAVNRFAGEALHFVRPLVARWMRPTPGAATWALSEPSVLAEFLRCLG